MRRNIAHVLSRNLTYFSWGWGRGNFKSGRRTQLFLNRLSVVLNEMRVFSTPQVLVTESTDTICKSKLLFITKLRLFIYIGMRCIVMKMFGIYHEL